ncbi:MAG: PQQ-dependent sugar dehydrogenase, partial [Bacteroidota bacterium]
MMKNLLSVLGIMISLLAFGQGVYVEPQPLFINSQTARLYVDITSTDCNCPELLDADPVTNPLYIWSWAPNEIRPEILVDGGLVNTNNGSWTDSNENLRMSVDENNPNLWFYDFLNVSLTQFYDVSAAAFEDGISFLVKEKNGAPQDLPEQKSPDLDVQFDYSTQGTENFSIDFENVLLDVTSPTAITHARDERIFLTEQAGSIIVFDRNGNVQSSEFLNIEDRVVSGGERGLLGIAFEPNFSESGRFYVNYTNNDDGLKTRISRFELDADNPEIGDPDSEEILIEFDQDFSNHNGGHIEFGPDGFLYIGTGDGGNGGDPNNRAQDITSYLGKMLRIDVSPLPGSAYVNQNAKVQAPAI